MTTNPRDESGRFIPHSCPDLNCGGSLVAGTDRFGHNVWHCDGLTYDRDDGPLRACEVAVDMPFRARLKREFLS
jgi:hypothetical protein